MPTSATVPIRLVSARLAVPDADAAARFYVRALDFTEHPARAGARNGSCTLALGEESIQLDDSGHAAGSLPPVASDDPSFAHLAIVTRDVDAAFARAVEAGATPVSPHPQRIPDDNPAAGGVRAAYLRDPHGHPFELIWFPPGRGDARWQRPGEARLLGIDHLARVTTDTARALGFYRDTLGFEVASESVNEGVEQERLAWVRGARVHVTSLRQRGSQLGIELLEYLAPAPRLAPPRSGRAPFLTELFETPHLDRAMESLEAHGFACEAGPPGDRVATATDADGHDAEVAERR